MRPDRGIIPSPAETASVPGAAINLQHTPYATQSPQDT
jgi:hypothetical protein